MPPPGPAPTPTTATTTKGALFDIFDQAEEKIKKTLESEFAKLTSEMTEHFTKLEQISGTITKTLGRGRDFAFGMRQTFADAMPDVIALGGTLEDIGKIQGDVVTATGRGVQLAADEFKKLYATTKVLNTDASDLFTTFKKIGVSIHDVGKESEKIIGVAQKYGLNVEQVYDAVSRNIEKINAYNFQNGVDGLAKMAAKATALKIDMGTTFDFADKVMDPEGAINMANAFQRLGAGTSALLDPLKLMDLSMNDPEELQNQLVKMTQQYTKFNKETGRFEITNKRMFRELAKELGMSYNELTKMALGGADLNKKLSEIRFPDLQMSQEQKEMIANMAEMKDGQYVVRVQEGGEIKEKKITELSDENLKYLSQAPKTAEEIQKQSLDTQTSMAQDIAAIRARVTGAVARSPMVEQTTRMARGVTETLNKFLDKQNINAKSISKLGDDVVKGMGSALTSGDMSKLLPVIEKIQGVGSKDPSAMVKEIIALYKENPLYKSNLGESGETIKKLEKFLLERLGGNVKKPGDFIVTENEFIEPDEKDILFGIHSDKLKSLTSKEDQKVKESTNNIVSDVIPKTIDSRSIISVLEQMSNSNKTESKTEKTIKLEPMDVNVNFNMTVTGVDSDIAEKIRIELSMKRGYLGDAISKAVTDAINNNGMTGPTKKGLPS